MNFRLIILMVVWIVTLNSITHWIMLLKDPKVHDFNNYFSHLTVEQVSGVDEIFKPIISQFKVDCAKYGRKEMCDKQFSMLLGFRLVSNIHQRDVLGATMDMWPFANPWHFKHEIVVLISKDALDSASTFKYTIYHELGHVVGYGHSTRHRDIMYPYDHYIPPEDWDTEVKRMFSIDPPLFR